MIVNKKTQNIIGNIKYFIVHLLLKYFLFFIFFSILYSKFIIKFIKHISWLLMIFKDLIQNVIFHILTFKNVDIVIESIQLEN